MTHLDWLVLDATADDFESIVQIADNVRCDLAQTSRAELARHIIERLRDGFLQQHEPGAISLEDLVLVPERLEPPCWFGMTARGAEASQRSAPDVGSEPPVWTRAYSCPCGF